MRIYGFNPVCGLPAGYQGQGFAETIFTPAGVMLLGVTQKKSFRVFCRKNIFATD